MFETCCEEEHVKLSLYQFDQRVVLCACAGYHQCAKGGSRQLCSASDHVLKHLRNQPNDTQRGCTQASCGTCLKRQSGHHVTHSSGSANRELRQKCTPGEHTYKSNIRIEQQHSTPYTFKTQCYNLPEPPCTFPQTAVYTMHTSCTRQWNTSNEFVSSKSIPALLCQAGLHCSRL